MPCAYRIGGLLDFTHEAVAASMNRANELWIRRFITKHPAQAFDCLGQGGVGDVRVGPDSRVQLVARNNSARPLEEHSQDLGGARWHEHQPVV